RLDKCYIRAIAESEDAGFGLDPARGGPEHFNQTCARAPEHWRFGGRWWWRVFAEGLKELSDESVGRPVRQTDLTTGFTDAQHLGSGPLLIGREHHAECRDHRID